MGEYAGWEFEEGAEIAPGRAVLKTIGGGNRYEVCLVWTRHLDGPSLRRLIRFSSWRR